MATVATSVGNRILTIMAKIIVAGAIAEAANRIVNAVQQHILVDVKFVK